MNDLNYYEKLLLMLEEGKSFNTPNAEIEAMMLQCNQIKKSIQERLTVDKHTVTDEQDFYKAECSGLLTRTLKLWITVKSKPIEDHGASLFKNSLILKMIQVLEDLYSFYNDFESKPVGKL